MRGIVPTTLPEGTGRASREGARPTAWRISSSHWCVRTLNIIVRPASGQLIAGSRPSRDWNSSSKQRNLAAAANVSGRCWRSQRSLKIVNIGCGVWPVIS